MDTPPSIRRQYASPPRETPVERRQRLANRRAAKYRHFRSLTKRQDALDPSIELQRQQNSRRQREHRSLLDADARDRLRAQNRRRQQLRRQNLSDEAKEEVRAKQRERQRQRRQTLDDDAREELRERERLRITRRRRQLKVLNRQQNKKQQVDGQEEILPAQLQLLQPSPVVRERLPHLRLAPELPTLRRHQELQRQREIQGQLSLSGGVHIAVTPQALDMERVGTFQLERMPSLPHLQQVTRPTTTSSSLHATMPLALFPMNGTIASGAASATSVGLPTVASAVAAVATMPSQPTTTMPSVSVPIQNKALTALPMVPKQQQPRTLIGLPPGGHRSLPPLPDFLNSRESFHLATAVASTSTQIPRSSSSANRALFPSMTDLPAVQMDALDAESFFQS
uniref:BZIP domain-containing protein n=1 Tax=Peronospora matthiolae TaxID=2874970 RepID=A0AAV1T420_9STRA